MEHIYSVVALATVVSSLLYNNLTSSYGFWKQRSIPYLDKAIPGLGNVYPVIFLRRSFGDVFQDFYNEMSNHSMFGFYHFRTPPLMVRDPELVKTVLSKSFQNFAKNSFELNKDLDPLLVVNPFFADEATRRTSRQQLTSAFTPGKLRYMYASVNEACVKLREYIDKRMNESNGKVELEMKDLFSRYTVEVLASAAFDVDGRSFESNKEGPFTEMGRLMFEPKLIKGLTQVAILFFPYLDKILRNRFMPVKADRFFRKVVKDVLKHREEQASFFVGGYESSNMTLSFLCYQLAAHPEIQDRLRTEVNNSIAKHGGLTYEALQEMSYMEQTPRARFPS